MLYRFYVGTGYVEARDAELETLERAQKWALAAFGGFTVFPASGGWTAPNGDQVEPTLVWEVLTDNEEWVEEFRKMLLTAYHQEEVLVIRVQVEVM